ncbi:cytochrome c-type biogenesis protein CcmH [bacterium]|nr:cytochrome c-type biogenesis protein CcmH [bacterium]NUN44383.1 cytochrome c-type biogenesis protein CcmH [bacterium]
MKKLKIYCIASLLITSVLYSQGGSAHTTKLNAEQNEMFNKISGELICQCGCNLVLGTCGHINCPSAVPMRNTIEDMIVAGKSHDAIIQYFMTEYSFRDNPPAGKAILSQPETKGFDLLAWIMPFLLFVIFIIVVVFLIKKITAGKTAPVTVSPAHPADDPYAQRIEEELKKMDR